MKVLLGHTYYQQRGGEDISFEQEAALLETNGHQVVHFTLHNDAVCESSRLSVAAKTLWNRQTYRDLRRVLHRERPDVAHFTNTFPLLSPSVYSAARAERVPVVQALRNYRLLCANAQLMRDGQVCESCLGTRTAWPAIQHACYRGSRAATAVVVASNALHRLLGTYQRKVDCFYTLTEFARKKFLQAGFAPDRVLVKPNYVPRPSVVPPASRRGAVFVGRLSAEKGIDTLLAAWRLMPPHERLTIIGDGPLADRVREATGSDGRIRWLGPLSESKVLEQMAQAAVLVMPSIWYETFGRTIVEAYSVGTPVLASRLGAMAELVEEGRTGRLFHPAEPADLAGRLSEMLSDQDGLARMSRQSLEVYETRYTPERNHELLLDVYRQAIRRQAGQTSSTSATHDLVCSQE